MSFGIRELAEKAKAQGAEDLAQGVINAPPPAVLMDAMKGLSFDRCSIYNNKRGVLIYREAVRDYLGDRNWKLGVENIMGTAGVIGGISAAIMSELKKDESILIPEPFFIGHRLLMESIKNPFKYFRTGINDHVDWKTLRKEMSKVDALIITSPSNPTGQVVPADILVEFSQEAAKNKCLLILDEVYREFNWSEKTPDDSIYAQLDLSYTVIARSFSKTLAIPGWRVGFAITSPERIERMATVHDSIYIGGSTIAQYALAEALKNHGDEIDQYVRDLRKLLEQNRDKLAKAFQDYGMEPVLPIEGAYYMLIKHNRASDVAAMEELMEKKVVVTPANILYSDPSKDTGYIRIHFGVSADTADKVAKALA